MLAVSDAAATRALAEGQMEAAALGLTAFLFFGSSADKPRLDDLQIAIEGHRVEASFELVNAFTDELFERIQTGLASGFTYQFVLTRDQKRWFDNRLDASTMTSPATP